VDDHLVEGKKFCCFMSCFSNLLSLIFKVILCRGGGRGGFGGGRGGRGGGLRK
jgi:hypothetical protein